MFGNGRSPFGPTRYGSMASQQHQAFQRRCAEFREATARSHQMWQAQLRRNRQQWDWLNRQQQIAYYATRHTREQGVSPLGEHPPDLSDLLKRRR